MKPVTIRFDEKLLKDIRSEAARQGIPYQTWVKMILLAEIRRASRRKDAKENEE